MPILLLKCVYGFLDSEEGLTIGEDRLLPVKSFSSRNMSNRKIVNKVRDIAGPSAYYHIYKGRVEVFDYITEN